MNLITHKYFLPYDVYERHRKVSSFIGKDLKVLDIGGELKHLSQFSRENKIIVANLNTGDVIISKNKLPFSQNTFDVVCAIDVLEHIPKNKRAEFIKRLINVASTKVILSFPISTRAHLQYEKEIKEKLDRRGVNVAYLEEHLKFGLPTPGEIKKITQGYSTSIFYSGNLTINKLLFNIFLFDPQIKIIRPIIYYLKLLFHFIFNPILYWILSNQPYSNTVNRAYIILNKSK